MSQIFLSYAHEDQPFALLLVKVLEAKGWDVFWDHVLLPGQPYADVIQSNLSASECVIVLWSKSSIESPWVKDEADEGRNTGRLISVVIDDVSPPLGFRQGQIARLDRWDGDPNDRDLAMLIKGVAANVSRRNAPRDGSPAPTLPAQPTPPFPSPSETSPTDDDVPEPASPALPQQAPATRPAPEPARRPEPNTIPAHRRSWAVPTALIVLVLIINFVQTTLDPQTTPVWLGKDAGYPIVQGFRWFENNLSFDSHEATSRIAMFGYSVSYFFLFPIVAVCVAVAFAFRRDKLAYQTLALAIAITYFVSLPFFFLMPIPERWAFPEANAILLSDLWTASLIEAFRPMSGLDNCFPSFHTALSVLVAVAAYSFKMRFRFALLAIAGTIMLATIGLGIHWLPDMIAGALLGALSVPLAKRLITSGSMAWLGLGVRDTLSAGSHPRHRARRESDQSRANN